jgi:hypothetical protein
MKTGRNTMTQKSFNVAVGNISVRDFGKVEDEDNRMVTCTLTVAGRDYECAEYIDADDDLCTGSDSHLSVNGIRNVGTGKMEPFVDNTMDGDDYKLWTDAEGVVVTTMKAFLDERVPEIRWHLNWAHENALIFGGDDHGSLEDAERAALTWEAELRDMCVEDWLLEKHLAGEMRIFPVVDGEILLSYVKTILVRDIVGAEPSLAA